MPPNVAGNFSATGGVTHVDCVLQIELFCEGGKIVGVGVHLVAIPSLRGTTVASPVMRDHAITALAEEQHLAVPVVRSERPAVTEHDGLACSPVLIVNLRTVFRGDGRHCLPPVVIVFACIGSCNSAKNHARRALWCSVTLARMNPGNRRQFLGQFAGAAASMWLLPELARAAAKST